MKGRLTSGPACLKCDAAASTEAWNRRASQAAPAPSETCPRCMGNGEIVTDWDAYLHPPKDATEEAVADCPDCDGTGHVVAAPAPSDGLREENERLRAHIRTMQGYVQEYLEPTPYVAKHGAGSTFHEPHRHQDEAHAFFMRQQMREAVLNDLIYMLDGPEECAALSASLLQGSGE